MPAGVSFFIQVQLLQSDLGTRKYGMKEYDVLVIGAGAAGLMAAHEIALAGRKVCVIEAKEKCGGRIQTFYTAANYPLEAGAEFIHGDLPLTMQLAKKAGLNTSTVGGSIWQKKDGGLQEQEDFIDDYSEKRKFMSSSFLPFVNSRFFQNASSN